jgi:pimeloyl-ACP methyl ester carboxylesterase
MKTFKTLITLLLLSSFQFSNAQFEDKFYYPKKEWNKIAIPFTEYFISVEKDSIHTAFFSTKKTPKATILFFHGAGGNISTYMYMIQPLVENGYQVYAVDFRGFGKSTGKPTHLNIAKDVEVVYAKMKKNTAIKNMKIIVYGASLGCQIATYVAKNHQQEIAALVLDSGFSSFADIATKNAPKEYKQYIQGALDKVYPSKEEIKNIKNMPKLIIHGKTDASIPFHHSEIVFQNAQEPKTFFNSTVGHIDSLQFETEKVIKEIDKLIIAQ